MTVMVKKIGGSMAVVIPKAVARDMALTEGAALEISGNADEIVLRKQDRRPRRSLKRLVAQMKPASYRRHTREQRDGGGPVGKELW